MDYFTWTHLFSCPQVRCTLSYVGAAHCPWANSLRLSLEKEINLNRSILCASYVIETNYISECQLSCSKQDEQFNNLMPLMST